MRLLIFLESVLFSKNNLKVYDLECVSMKKKDFGKWFPLSWTRDYFPEAKYNSVYGQFDMYKQSKNNKNCLNNRPKINSRN